MAPTRNALRLAPILLIAGLAPASAQSAFDATGIDGDLAAGITLCYDMLLSTKQTVAGLESDGWDVYTFGDEPYYSDVSADRSGEASPSESLFLGMETYPENAKVHFCTLDVTNSTIPSTDGLSDAFGAGLYEQSEDGYYAIWDDNGLLGRLSLSDVGYFVQITLVEGN